jgi:hypothetical protein
VGPPAVFDSHHTMPAWSPDGTQIAYVHLDDDEIWGNCLGSDVKAFKGDVGRIGDRE